MYDATPDPYCYPGTSVLKNIPGIRNQAELDRFETAITAQRGEEPLPLGRFGVSHYRAIHHHLFQDVYPWAGRFRTLRIAKGESVFCYPEHIAAQMSGTFAELKKNRYLRDLPSEIFANSGRPLPRRVECDTSLPRRQRANATGIHGNARRTRWPSLGARKTGARNISGGNDPKLPGQ